MVPTGVDGAVLGLSGGWSRAELNPAPCSQWELPVCLESDRWLSVLEKDIFPEPGSEMAVIVFYILGCLYFVTCFTFSLFSFGTLNPLLF